MMICWRLFCADRRVARHERRASEWSSRRTRGSVKWDYVIALARTTAGINKTEGTGSMDAPIGFADALRWIFPPVLARYVVFHGWIRQETLCDRSSVTFDLRLCIRQIWLTRDTSRGEKTELT